MAENRTLNTRLRLKYDTAANWATKNPVLLAGEVGIESDTLLGKVGDGEKTWQQLEYLSANKVNSNLIIKLNNGKTEGTNLFTFNGSEAKTINITPNAIGAAASSHGTHVTADTVKAALGIGSGTSKYLREDGTWQIPPDTHYTNYLQIKGNGTEAIKFTQNANKILNFKPGNNVSISAAADEITISATNTDTKVTSVDNHYSPTASSESELTATINGTAGTYAKDTEYTVLTGVKVQRDAKGHVTGITYTAQKIKDTNTTYTIPTKSSWDYDDRYVKYSEEQELNNTQKERARSNIGAAKSDHTHNYAGSDSVGGAATSANKVNAALTFNNSGNGVVSGTAFDGSTARTISYNTIGAAASSHNHDDKYLTGITMNGASKGTSGVVDLGTVLTDASKFATSAQGTKADNAMPKSGGTFTGEVKFGSTENFQGYYIKRMLGSLGAGTAYANLDSSYKDGTWHRMWRLRFPSGSNFWGKIKITLYGTYSSFNASGVMSKSITCNFNTSSIYNNVGCYDGLGVNVEKDFRISEAIWNATANAWEVLIWQKNLSGNNSPTIMLECWTTNNTKHINAFNGITAQTVELTQSTSYSAQKASSTGGTKTVEWATLPVYENPLGEEIVTVAMLENKQDKITSNNKLSASLVSDLAKVATSGSYNDLLNKPTKLSDFTDDKVIKFTNTTVAASAFVADTNYSNYGYCASISLSGVTANDTADVYFSGKQVEQEIYASFCESYAGGVKIYAAEKPSEAVIIPLILIHK